MTDFPNRARLSEEPPTIPRLLGFAGLLPFAGAAAMSWFGPESLFGHDALTYGRGYGAVILSFLGGIRWGLALGPLTGRARDRDIVLSVIPSLIGWLALLFDPAVGLVLLMIGFSGQLAWDLGAAREGLIPDWFKELRMALTFGAIAGLLLLLPSVA